MSMPQVQTASPEEQKSVADIITLGFAADPIARWVWPDAGTYLRTMPRFTMAFGGGGFTRSSVYRTDCGYAAAMWLPPGVHSDDEGIETIFAETIAPERMEEIGSFFEQMDTFHPQEECWYLPLIAADPSQTGRGLGAALMKYALQKCDEQCLPAYLESSNPRNISLYERHGFEVMGKIETPSSPLMTPMYRPPRS
ncbi:Puromycin N-acetyltransferase [Altererythrobacter insulae]|nr:Puromycin N-acetyltransferase [Altererythrobacter insulae]